MTAYRRVATIMGAFLNSITKGNSNPVVKPERLFYIRKDGHAVLHIPIKPNIQQKAANALYRLMQENPLMKKGEVALLTIIHMAELIEDNPSIADYLHED